MSNMTLTERVSDLVSKTFRPRQYAISDLRATQNELLNLISWVRLDRLGGSGRYQLDNKNLTEYDARMLDRLVRHMGDVYLSPYGTSSPDEGERLREVESSRYLARFDPTGRQSIRLWTSFGFGKNVNISITMQADTASQQAMQRISDQAPDTTGEPETSTSGNGNGATATEAMIEPANGATATEAMIEPANATTPTAQDWFDEFWTAGRNRPVLKPRRLHYLSDTLLEDGEIIFLFFIAKSGTEDDEEAVPGRVTVRLVPTEQITGRVTEQDDSAVTLWYKREWIDTKGNAQTRYYPSIEQLQTPVNKRNMGDELPDGAMRADEERDDVDVVCLLVPLQEDKYGRGWPLLTASDDWIRGLREYAQDMASVTAANALYWAELKHQGGSRATDALVAKLRSSLSVAGNTDYYDTNPPPAAGAIHVSNKAANLQAVPHNDTSEHSTNTKQLLTMMAGLGAGLFPHYLGSGEAFRLATAQAMEAPLQEMWTLYKLSWEDVFRDIVNLVLDSAEIYGGMDYPEELRDIDVMMDALWAVDLDKFASAFQMLAPYISSPRMREQLVLQAFNVADVQDQLDKYYPEDDTSVAAEEAMVERAVLALREAYESAETDEQRSAAMAGLQVLGGW